MRGIPVPDGEGGTTWMPLYYSEIRCWIDPERHDAPPGYPPGFAGYAVWDAEAGVVARFASSGGFASQDDGGQIDLMRAMVDALKAGGERRAQVLAVAEWLMDGAAVVSCPSVPTGRVPCTSNSSDSA